MLGQVLSHFAGMMWPSIVEDQHMIFVQLRPQFLQPLQHLVALQRAFKTPGSKDLFSTHRRDEGLFPGLSSLMVEVLHRLSHGSSCPVANPVIVESRFVTPEELYLGFLQQLGQLYDKVLPLLLPALREGFRRDGSVFLSVHLSFLRCTLTACSVTRTPQILSISSAYSRRKASGYCWAYSAMHWRSRS